MCEVCGSFGDVHYNQHMIRQEMANLESMKHAVDGFRIKDSGKRQEFAGGMVRDTVEGKTNYLKLLDGPMFDRWAEHLTKGALKYPDVSPGVANWTLANGEEELQRFKQSAFNHFRKWLRGDQDEDHAAGLFFNVNGYEFVKDKMAKKGPLAS